MTDDSTFDVGGVRLARPFRIRRLGHFQFLSADMSRALPFYTDLLGFKVTDTIDFGPRITSPEMRARVADPKIYFMRYGSDHHSVILSSPVLLEVIHGHASPNAAIGQITWQVGSLKEVAEGFTWFAQLGRKILRSGRDQPGSNWHTYIPDEAGHPNEIYYGIEQIGWDGLSKPAALHAQTFRELPPLPYVPEYHEIAEGAARGVGTGEGTCSLETLPATFDVDGILLPRPFKVVGIGPVRLLARDLDAAVAFYRDELGLRITEEIIWRGHRCVFLRANTEHHAMALYPEALRGELDLVDSSQCLSFGLRLANYRQLRDAVAFLRGKGVEIRFLPPELSPGMNYTAFAVDPGGHLVQLYCDMEQIGWDGRPRPAELRPTIRNDAWPEQLEEQPDTYGGEVFLGPWS